MAQSSSLSSWLFEDADAAGADEDELDRSPIDDDDDGGNDDPIDGDNGDCVSAAGLEWALLAWLLEEGPSWASWPFSGDRESADAREEPVGDVADDDTADKVENLARLYAW
jgi:hypothetical protein